MGAPGPNCKPRTCKLCGTKFVPTSSHQSCCGRDIEVPCVVCGAVFTKKCTTADNKKTCSEKCNLEYQKIRRAENAKKQKKICKWCGKEFYASHVRVVYCDGPHYKKCAVCGKDFEFDPKSQMNTQTCSKECFVILQLSHRDIPAEIEKQKRALMEKYGVDNAAKIPGSMEKAKETTRERYGVDWYTQTQEYKERVKETSLEKYGVEHWLSNPEIIAKREQTCLEKYGVSNLFRSSEIQSKIRADVKSNFGVNSYSQLHIKDVQTWNNFRTDPKLYLQGNITEKITFQELAQLLGVSVPSVQNVIYAHQDLLEQYIKRDSSKMETSVALELQNLIPDIRIHRHVRKYIYPYELDLYLPDYNIGIECNPSWTHNSSNIDPWSNTSHDSNYHLMKTELAEKQGIRLFHIFGHEWIHHKEAVESLIINMLHCETKIYLASDIEIKSESVEKCVEFLTKYCIHGARKFDTNVCIVDKNTNEIIVLMTFNQLDDFQWELADYCFASNVHIVGDGLNLLFQKFIEKHDPLSVIAFADRAHYSDEFYIQNKFQLQGYEKPSYTWVNVTTEECIDEGTYLEEELLSMDYVKVYDSGAAVWEYTK